MKIEVSVKIPKNLVNKLDAMAKLSESSRSFHIQKALKLYIEEPADLQIALERLNDGSYQFYG